MSEHDHDELIKRLGSVDPKCLNPELAAFTRMQPQQDLPKMSSLLLLIGLGLGGYLDIWHNKRVLKDKAKRKL
ncbi:MAG: hypothetical protein EBU26_14380 [Verrucomicrobia bacterium]|nr:hypothetical protein [Verrucomicrobiota bacterium]